MKANINHGDIGVFKWETMIKIEVVSRRAGLAVKLAKKSRT